MIMIDNKDRPFSGRTAIVTGASRGIGRAVTIKFASMGADVAIIYAGSTEKAESAAEVCREYGVRAAAYRCDVSDYNAAKDTVKQITTEFGTVDILVNNAGITRDKLVISMREEDFSSVIDTNLKGAFNMTRHCYPIMAKNRSGKIINISSVSGLIGNSGQANYSASKAGIIGLTKSVAKELAGRGICCNAIAPGFVETDMTSGIAEDNPLLEAIPMKRFAKPEEIAELAAFLAGSGSDYITGEVIRIDGGLAM